MLPSNCNDSFNLLVLWVGAEPALLLLSPVELVHYSTKTWLELQTYSLHQSCWVYSLLQDLSAKSSGEILLTPLSRAALC